MDQIVWTKRSPRGLRFVVNVVCYALLSSQGVISLLAEASVPTAGKSICEANFRLSYILNGMIHSRLLSMQAKVRQHAALRLPRAATGRKGDNRGLHAILVVPGGVARHAYHRSSSDEAGSQVRDKEWVEAEGVEGA